MKSVTAKELKNKTGDVLRCVRGGEKVLVTKRGKPCALISPVGKEELAPKGIRPYEAAWEEIERTLKATKAHHRTWREAIQWSRRLG